MEIRRKHRHSHEPPLDKGHPRRLLRTHLARCLAALQLPTELPDPSPDVAAWLVRATEAEGACHVQD